MQWFKHVTDNHRGQSVQGLLDAMGYFGPFFYYLMYELCAEKLDQKSKIPVTLEDCNFEFHHRIVCSASRAKLPTVRRALDAGQSCGLWTYFCDGSVIKISVPILLELLDRDMKNARKVRAKHAQDTRLDKDKELDKDIDIELASKKISDPMGYLKPENQAYIEVLKRVEIFAGAVRTKVDLVRETFDTADDLGGWIQGVTEAKGFKDKPSADGKKRYLAGALLREIGAIA